MVRKNYSAQMKESLMNSQGPIGNSESAPESTDHPFWVNIIVVSDCAEHWLVDKRVNIWAGSRSTSTDENSVEELEASGPMPKLRILRASRNRLQELDLGFFPNLRTLYLDNNALRSLGKLERLTKLENLSLRNQIGQAL
jgi:Leucine-rich repeat (LRR) protein